MDDYERVNVSSWELRVSCVLVSEENAAVLARRQAIADDKVRGLVVLEVLRHVCTDNSLRLHGRLGAKSSAWHATCDSRLAVRLAAVLCALRSWAARAAS